MAATTMSAFAAVVSLTTADLRANLVVEACGGAELSDDSACSLLTGEDCEEACYGQDNTALCEVECGLQDCHEYDCYEWRCVEDCLGQHLEQCLDGCASLSGVVFCDGQDIASGLDAGPCVDSLCEQGIAVQGGACC